jgi:hypothetical protein
MKILWFWFIVLFVCYTPSAVAQDPEPLNPEWLAKDFQSVELVSLLASPSALTVQGIRDILRVVGDSGDDEDLGFDATTFDIGKGNGYTRLYVEGLVFKGNIGFYKIGIETSSEHWSRIRERVIELWKHNRGPDFDETETGIVHVETNEAVLMGYRSAVSAALGKPKQAAVPDELKKSFYYLTSPLECTAIGPTDGDMAIDALVNANRVDLIENVLRGFSPSGRVYAAQALLRLSKKNEVVLSADIVSTIEKVRSLDLPITTVHGCIVSRLTANDILSDQDESEEPK